jgi:hypothetical protein
MFMLEPWEFQLSVGLPVDDYFGTLAIEFPFVLLVKELSENNYGNLFAFPYHNYARVICLLGEFYYILIVRFT